MPPPLIDPMRHPLFIAVWSGLLTLAGCNPTFNWRDVRPGQTPLVALFPCKPDQDARMVSLGAKDVTLTILGCETGNTTFTLAYADTKDAASTGVVLDQWKSATLASIRAPASRERPFRLKGASTLPPPVQVQANGVRQNGADVTVQAVWFAAGSLVYQAAVYADTADATVAETYFAGLQLP
jgi:hypothetical protein